MHGYAVTDLLGALGAASLFSLFFLPPGFLIGNASNVLGFRGRSASERFLISVVLSVAVAPSLAVSIARYSSLTVTVVLFLAAAAVSLALVLRELLSGGLKAWSLDRSTRIALVMMAVWVALALLTLVDWQTGERLYISYSAYDHSIRAMMVDAAARTGVPPRNPMFSIGTAPMLRYYYYWYVMCALPVHLAGITPRASFNGSVLWSGFALAALIPLYLKHFSQEKEHLRLKSLVGVGLLLVTGYDLIPYADMTRRLRTIVGDMEWWDTNQVTSWIGSLIWVPHHVASMTACLTGFLLLISLPENARPRERIWAAVLAGAAFSSAAGLSLYVTFVFAVFMVVWGLIFLLWKGPVKCSAYLGSAVVSILLARPYLKDLTQGPSASGGRFAFFAFRDYPIMQQWLRLQGVTNEMVLRFSRYPGLILVYFFEFGVFFLAWWYCFRRETRNGWKLTINQWAGWVMFAVSLLVVTFVSSDATASNDLGFRGILVVQFVLLIWAAPLVSELFLPRGQSQLGSAWKLALAGSVILGVLGTFAQLAILRFYEPIVNAGICRRTDDMWMGPSTDLGKHTLRLRESVEQLRKVAPTSAILQYNPHSQDIFLLHLYLDRQTAIGDDGCGAAFGGDQEKCKQVFPFVNAAFNSQAAARTWDMDKYCNLFHINMLVSTDSDSVWKDNESWVWNRQPLLATDNLRAFACGSTLAGN